MSARRKILTPLILTALLVACNQTGIPEARASDLKRVPTDQVCMVNDEFMAKKQIPIHVRDKTYYGCCQMCVSTLTNDAGARHAIDPINGHTVDKATAVIGARTDSSVLYFESEATFTAWQQHEKGETP